MTAKIYVFSRVNTVNLKVRVQPFTFPCIQRVLCMCMCESDCYFKDDYFKRGSFLTITS